MCVLSTKAAPPIPARIEQGLTQHTRVYLMRHAALFLFILSALFNTVMVLLGLVLIAIWGTTP